MIFEKFEYARVRREDLLKEAEEARRILAAIGPGADGHVARIKAVAVVAAALLIPFAIVSRVLG